jgi:hypothetical protein
MKDYDYCNFSYCFQVVDVSHIKTNSSSIRIFRACFIAFIAIKLCVIDGIISKHISLSNTNVVNVQQFITVLTNLEHT